MFKGFTSGFMHKGIDKQKTKMIFQQVFIEYSDEIPPDVQKAKVERFITKGKQQET